jgi:hypothetical protein
VVSTPPAAVRIRGGWARRPRQLSAIWSARARLCSTPGLRRVVGEQIAVNYRTVGRAVGRAVNTASQQALAQAGSPAVAAWIGSVTSPAARSSADCRNAALVMEQAAASVSALWSGTYKGTRQLRRRCVAGRCAAVECAFDQPERRSGGAHGEGELSGSYPDLVEYAIAFANDWADDLAIKTSATVPADAWLPAPSLPQCLPI